jgi:hypothetical protein
LEDHILDLSKRLWSTSRYGLTVIGTWVRLGGRWRPCMAILRENRPEFQPCVVPLDNAWQWSDAVGDPVPRAVAMLPRLGVDPTNPDNVHKLVSLVNSRMRDLVAMPPRPADAEEHANPVANVTLSSDLSGTIEVEI